LAGDTEENHEKFRITGNMAQIWNKYLPSTSTTPICSVD